MRFGSSWMGEKNPKWSYYGYLTAAGSDKYVEWQLDDTDDWYHLRRQDSYVQGFKVEMPVAVSHNGTVNFVVTDSGKIGIGTTSPSYIVHVVENSSGSAAIRLDQIGDGNAFFSLHVRETGGDALLGFGIDDAEGNSIGHSWHLGIDNDDDDAFVIAQGSPESANLYMKISLNGQCVLSSSGSSSFTVDGGTVNSPFFALSQEGDRVAFIQYVDSTDMLRLVNEYGGIEFWTGSAGTYTKKVVVDKNGYIGIGTSSPNYKLEVNGLKGSSPTTLTISNDGVGGSSPSATLTPSTSFCKIDCQDPDGCNVTISESGAADGAELTVVNVSANTVNISDSGGVTELAGNFAMGQWDSLSLIYVGDRWVEVSRSSN